MSIYKKKEKIFVNPFEKQISGKFLIMTSSIVFLTEFFKENDKLLEIVKKFSSLFVLRPPPFSHSICLSISFYLSAFTYMS